MAPRAFRFALAIAASFAFASAACSSAPVLDDEDESSSRASRGGDGFADGGQVFGGSSNVEGGASSASCLKAKTDGTKVPVYLSFVFDKSLSMANGGRFKACSSALKTFFSDPKSNGLNASLQFFPLSPFDCSDSLYATPRVAMRELPDPNAFSTAIDAEGPNVFSTPALPALRSAIAYLRGVKASPAAKAGAKVAIVLVTDGEPVGCGSNVQSVSKEVASVKNEIPTFVIGLGDQAALDAIAAAGGTNKAFQLNTSDPTKIASDFGNVLDTLRGSQFGCEFKLPAVPSGEKFDPAAVNVVAKPGAGGGSSEVLTYDKDCTSGGWRYDDPASPSRIQVCPATCSSVLAKGGNVDIEVGCVTKGTNGSIPR